MAWQPNPEALDQLVGCLRDSLSAQDPAAQKQATIMLSQAKASPDITNYLTFIITNLNSETKYPQATQILARSSAAITLKNFARTHYKTIPPQNLSYIKSSILLCLQDPNAQIRNFVGNVISELVKQGGITAWPEIIPELLSLAGNEKNNLSPQVQEGAVSALAKICEDCKKSLDREYNGQRPLDVIIPKLLQLTTSTIPKVRSLALECVNSFIPQKPRALQQNVDLFLSQLFNLATDPNEEVRRFVCRSFVQLVDVAPAKLVPHMEGLVKYFVSQHRTINNADLALDAAEFWLSIGENKEIWQSLGPFLPAIIPTLLESMVYSEDDVARLEAQAAEDAHQEDRPEDLKPQFAQTRAARSAQEKTVPNGAEGTSASKKDDLSEGEIEESDEEHFVGDPEDEWNLRKCSAAALDTLASSFHRPVFDITLPYLRDNLSHHAWPNREAAVLAIGAIADGCMDVVIPHLPELVPYLISLLQDPVPVVRQITCWALGRYSKWAAHLQDPGERARYFEPMMDGILQRMLDGNKSVQEAAASGFSIVEEKARGRMQAYCKPVLQQFVKCFDVYKDRNMFILYDCVQTLAEHVGPTLQQPENLNLLMPALLGRWSKLSDQSRELFPLLECLSYVATALGDSFSPYAPEIFSRCIKIIHQNLEAYLAAANNQALDIPDKDYLITSLDLLSAIVQALPPATTGALITNTQPRMFDLLPFCLEDPSNDVRQSSYALLGDCALQIYEHMRPHLPTLLPLLITQLDLDSIPDEDAEAAFSVVNNACWACGEIAVQELTGITPNFESLYARLFGIISSPDVPSAVNENACIALGRLGLHYASSLAPHLAEFADPYLRVIEPVEYNDEKGQAFRGLNEAVMANPQAMESCLLLYFQAASAYPMYRYGGKDEVLISFKKVILGYQSMIPNFRAFVAQLSTEDQQRLQTNYEIQLS
ncbi:hypothetical protein MMC25_005215 [Agyrium rufum]|nr:hypothetical protein [Agyrium rufum]